MIYRVLCWLDSLGVKYTAPEVVRCRMIDWGYVHGGRGGEVLAGQICYALR